MTAGEEAEERVRAALRAALSIDYRLYPNVRWISKVSAESPARDGKTDLVIVHPEHGLLIIETKSGPISRSATGEWFSGSHRIDPPPFTQAEGSKRHITAKLASLPDWPGRASDIRAGHAVAFPDVALANNRLRTNLGADGPPDLVLDQAALETPESTKRWVDAAYAYWQGDGRRGQPLTPKQMELIDELMAPPAMELKPLLRRQIQEGEEEVITLTRGQLDLLNTLRYQRRASILGPAGTGKTMLAAEKARRLATEGFRTLLVCFNQPLAAMLAEELAPTNAPAGLNVLTFHELCLRLGREAGTLPAVEPTDKDQDWFDHVLPGALDAAIPNVGGRYHAIVVDEGQDFALGWLESLFYLLVDPESDVFYVFHDPAQALYRPDVVASLKLPEYQLDMNCRNPRAIHELAAAYHGAGDPGSALREGGRDPEIIAVEPGRATLEALRKVLHRLVVDEGVPPWQIGVLTGRSLSRSDVWKQRVFGNQVLWNGSYDDAGHSRGLAADQTPDQPSDTILCDSIRRFKGLEREVIVLIELDTSEARLEQLMYVGATRARQHLVVIGLSSETQPTALPMVGASSR